MSDRFDDLFDDLRGQPAPAPFAPAEAVRARGRQRSRRQAVAAVAAVVLAAAGGAGWVVTGVGDADSPPVAGQPTTGQPSPSPVVPEPSPDPEPDSDQDLGWEPVIGRPWLVVADDLPDEGWVETGHELFEDEPAWFWTGCVDPALIPLGLTAQRRDLATVSWYRDDGALPARVDQIVDLFEGPSAARRHLVDVERAAESCTSGGRVESPVPVEYESVDRDFVGSQSVLYRELQYFIDERGDQVPAGSYRYVAVVRVGPAVTTVIGLDQESTLVAARAATDRLAEGLPLPAYADPPGRAEPASPPVGEEGAEEVP